MSYVIYSNEKLTEPGKEQSLEELRQSIRLELLEQLRLEQEEKLQVEKEELSKKELYEHFKDAKQNGPIALREHIDDLDRSRDKHSSMLKIIFSHIASHEIILFWLYTNNPTKYIVFTNKKIYKIIEKRVSDQQRMCLCPMYTFSYELDVKSLILLKNIKSLVYFLIEEFTDNLNPVTHRKISIEKVIRMIPGSYEYGSWKELNGFFGFYMNEETYEISQVSPHIELNLI